MPNRVLVAIGGNALVNEGEGGELATQSARSAVIGDQIAEVVAAGHQVVLTHGNGPQVGYILRRSELVEGMPEAEGIPRVSLWMAGANSQGGIGHLLCLGIDNALARRGIDMRAIGILTNTEVLRDDPAFASPTKPIGPVFDAEVARAHREEGWAVAKTSGGFRRLVASPRPHSILEAEKVRHFMDYPAVIVAGGGGGVPVVATDEGWQPVDAVIDKDYTSALLAAELGIDTLILVTSVEHVYAGFGTAGQRRLDEVSAAEMRSLYEAGEFPPGSMGPKVDAALQFLAAGGGQAIITSLQNITRALSGNGGTRITA